MLFPGTSSMSKPVLYFSNYCEYCKTVQNFILKNCIQAEFAYVCVDTHRHLVPRVIRSVPSMILATEKRLLTDENVMRYVEGCCRKEVEVEAMEGNSSLAESFSWVDDNARNERENDGKNISGSRFVCAKFGNDGIQNDVCGAMPKPIDASTLKSNQTSDMDAALARLNTERTNDYASAPGRF